MLRNIANISRKIQRLLPCGRSVPTRRYLTLRAENPLSLRTCATIIVTDGTLWLTAPGDGGGADRILRPGSRYRAKEPAHLVLTPLSPNVHIILIAPADGAYPNAGRVVEEAPARVKALSRYMSASAAAGALAKVS